MPPKAGRRKKRAVPAGNASQTPQDASQITQNLATLPAQLPQDLNVELSFEDQSTPKNGTQGKKRGPKKGPGDLRPQRKGPGRPAAPRPSTDRTQDPAAATNQAQDEGAQPAKRTRKDKNTAGDEAQQQESTRRGKPSPVGEGNNTATDQPRRKAGRPAKNRQSRASEAEAATAKDAGPLREGAGNKRKRGRPSLQGTKDTKGENQREDGAPPGKKKREARQSDQQEQSENVPVKTRKRRRSSLETEANKEDASANSGPPRKRAAGRPSTKGARNNSNKSNKSPTAAAAQPTKRARKSRDADTSTTAETSTRKPQKPPSHPPLEEREADGDETDTPPSPTRNYRHISACLNSIPLDVVESTWSPLDPATIPLAASLLTYAERPVLDRLSNNIKRRDHATFVLRAVSRNVARRLSRQFPFPPVNPNTLAAVASTSSSSATATSAAAARGGRRRITRSTTRRNAATTADPREAELDYEQVLSTVKSLEKTLSTLQHGNRLLETEKAREEKALEREYAELDRLEANARSEARGLRESLKKSHALASGLKQQRMQKQQQVGTGDDLRIVTKQEGNEEGREEDKDTNLHLFGNLEELGLDGLDAQLGNHMESLRANLRPVEGVVPEILQSRAALRDILVKHLQPQRLEDAVLA